MEVVQRITGSHVVATLDRVRQAGTAPRSITVDHGTDLTSTAVDTLAFEHRITLDFTRPGKPTDNRHIASFNARSR